MPAPSAPSCHRPAQLQALGEETRRRLRRAFLGASFPVRRDLASDGEGGRLDRSSAGEWREIGRAAGRARHLPASRPRLAAVGRSPGRNACGQRPQNTELPPPTLLLWPCRSAATYGICGFFRRLVAYRWWRPVRTMRTAGVAGKVCGALPAAPALSRMDGAAGGRSGAVYAESSGLEVTPDNPERTAGTVSEVKREDRAGERGGLVRGDLR
jgi:hypothetical protein